MAALVGERVRLRALEPEDHEAGHRWFNDPEVTQYLLVGYVPVSREFERKWYEGRSPRPGDREMVFGIEAEDGTYIGNIALHDIHYEHGHAVLGIVIGEAAYRGRGYGTDAMKVLCRFAFQTLRLHKVWLLVDNRNSRAIRAYERVGFVREGVLRDHVFADGRFHDYVVMSVIATEFVC